MGQSTYPSTQDTVSYGGATSYVNTSLASGTTPVLPAPGVGKAYRIQSLYKSSTYGAGLGVIFGNNGYSTVTGYSQKSTITSNSQYTAEGVTVNGVSYSVGTTSYNSLTTFNASTQTVTNYSLPSGFTAVSGAPSANSAGTIIYIAGSSGGHGGYVTFTISTSTVSSFVAVTSTSTALNYVVPDANGNVWGIAGSSVGLWFYNVGTSTATQISSSVYTYTGPLGNGYPMAYCASSGYMYVCAGTSSSNGYVYVYNINTRANVTTITVGTEPNGLVVNGSTIYCSNYNASTISVINSSSNTVSTTISASANTTGGLVIDPTQTYLYSYGTGGVTQIYMATNTVYNFYTSYGAYGLFIDSTGSFGLLAGNGTTGVVITLSTMTLLGTFTVTGNTSNACVVSGQTFYINDQAVSGNAWLVLGPAISYTLQGAFASLLDTGSSSTPIINTTLVLNGRLTPPNQPIYVNNTSGSTATIEIGYDIVNAPTIS